MTLEKKREEQYVPIVCPFCGAAKNQFIPAEECSEKYEIVSTDVNQKVSRLNSHPRLGLNMLPIV